MAAAVTPSCWAASVTPSSFRSILFRICDPSGRSQNPRGTFLATLPSLSTISQYLTNLSKSQARSRLSEAITAHPQPHILLSHPSSPSSPSSRLYSGEPHPDGMDMGSEMQAYGRFGPFQPFRIQEPSCGRTDGGG